MLFASFAAAEAAFLRPVSRVVIPRQRTKKTWMSSPLPKPPENLHPLSRELLESLVGHSQAAEIVIEGGVALSNYLEYRTTVHLDAWWRAEPRADVLSFLEAAMQALASRHGLDYRRRSWGETESLELIRDDRKEFSFQISRRPLSLDAAIPSVWQPVCIETLRDNIASKMTALVQRGAPRDFLDIYQICTREVMTMTDCWDCFTNKNPGVTVAEAKQKIIARLAMIETTRPLETIANEDAREQATRVRNWYHRVFASATS